MSGPVYIPKIYNGKDKTFWLFGFQRHHEKGGETATNAVPSPEMLAGNFAGLNPIYDPATTAFGQNALCQPAGSDCWYRTPFANNQVPVSRFDPAIKNFLGHNPYTPENNKQYALNLGLGPQNNLITPTNYRSYRTRFDAKVDQQFSSNHKMFGRYSQVRHRSWRDRLSPEIAWPEYDWRAVPIPIDQRNIALSDTITISPTMISELRLGYNRRRGTVFPSTYGQDWAKQLGIPNVSPLTFPNFQYCNTTNQPVELHGRNYLLPAGQQRSLRLAGSGRGLYRPGKPHKDRQQTHPEVRLRIHTYSVQLSRPGVAFWIVPLRWDGFSVPAEHGSCSSLPFCSAR